MKQIRMENGLILYYGNVAGSVADGRAVVDPMFQVEELASYLKNQKTIREIQWKPGVFDRLMSCGKEEGVMQMLKDCRVWQLKPEVNVQMKFISYETLLEKFGPPVLENYQMVFDGAVETNDLEKLYAKFNIDYPEGYMGHSLSISDVLELYDESGSSYYYVDLTGFQEVKFTPESLKMGQMMKQ